MLRPGERPSLPESGREASTRPRPRGGPRAHCLEEESKQGRTKPEQAEIGLRPHPVGCILSGMFIRGRAWPVRSSQGVTIAFTLAIALFGVLAAPFCRCNCGDHGTAAAAESAPCHAHAHHGNGDSTPSHPCEHAGCAGLTAIIPSLSGQALVAPAPAPSVGVSLASMGMQIVPSRLISMRPRIDRDVGPPVPAPLHTILRP